MLTRMLLILDLFSRFVSLSFRFVLSASRGSLYGGSGARGGCRGSAKALSHYIWSLLHTAHLAAAVVHAARVGAPHPHRLQHRRELRGVQSAIPISVQRVEGGAQPRLPRPHEALEAVEPAVNMQLLRCWDAETLRCREPKAKKS